MDPFKITIKRKGKNIGLNILAQGKLGFMVSFNGALVGEVFLDEKGDTWGAVSARELFKDGRDGYPCEDSEDCDGLMFDKKLINRIGGEISKVVGLSN